MIAKLASEYFMSSTYSHPVPLTDTVGKLLPCYTRPPAKLYHALPKLEKLLWNFFSQKNLARIFQLEHPFMIKQLITNTLNYQNPLSMNSLFHFSLNQYYARKQSPAPTLGELPLPLSKPRVFQRIFETNSIFRFLSQKSPNQILGQSRNCGDA
jgi:hypothetical protein